MILRWSLGSCAGQRTPRRTRRPGSSRGRAEGDGLHGRRCEQRDRVVDVRRCGSAANRRTEASGIVGHRATGGHRPERHACGVHTDVHRCIARSSD